MSHRIRTPLLALLASALTVGPALAGPPWISVEYPANPFDSATRSALLTVHTYHHGRPAQHPLRVVAVGVVDGERRRVELAAAPTSRTGVWAVSGRLPRGEWVVSATLTSGQAQATVLAGLGQDGRLVHVHVPSELREGMVVPREATQADVEAMLAGVRAAGGARVARGADAPSAAPLLAGLGLLALAPVALRRAGRRGR